MKSLRCVRRGLYTGAMSCSKKIPKFKSRDEEADFWDTHSPLDYGEWKEVKMMIARPLVHILGVRLDVYALTDLTSGSTLGGIRTMRGLTS